MKNQPQPSKRDWESRVSKALDDYANTIYYDGDPMRCVKTEKEDVLSLISHIREEAVGERDGELLREAYEMDKEKTRLAIESHKYPEGVHDPRIYALVRELQARADALKPKESL